MPKKSNTRRKDGRIAVQVYLGTSNGKRRYKTVYGKTQKEADAKADELRAQLHRGVDLASDKRAFDFWASRFLLSKKSAVSASWYAVLKQRMEHFSKRFGNTDVRKIRLCDVQTVLDDFALSNPYSGKPSSKKTLTNYASIIKQFFRYCAANRVIDRSPLEGLLTVPSGTPSKHRNALTSEQQSWIINTPHRAQAAAMIMLYAGLRRGELTALLWSDVDLEARTICVNKSYDARRKTVKSTKTAAGVRTVPIPDLLAKFMSTMPHTSALVCPSAQGTYMTDTSWTRMWESYMRTLNRKYGDFQNLPSDKRKALPMVIPTFTPHELRHTYATILYDAGVDVLTAKELMGHSDIKTTLSIYTHLSKEKSTSDIDKLNRFLCGETTAANKQ